MQERERGREGGIQGGREKEGCRDVERGLMQEPGLGYGLCHLGLFSASLGPQHQMVELRQRPPGANRTQAI